MGDEVVDASALNTGGIIFARREDGVLNLTEEYRAMWKAPEAPEATAAMVTPLVTEMWKPKEVASALNVKSRAIYAWVLAGKLGAIRTPGGHLRIPASEVKRLLSNGLEEMSDTPLTSDEG